MQPVRLQFQGNRRETKGGEGIFTFCHSSCFESSLVWLISPAVLIGDSPPTLWPRSTRVTNVFPWKQTCHATAGLSNEIHLCQRGTSWWPDWSHISTTVWLLKTKLLLNCVWVLAVIVRHIHIAVSFGLFVSQLPFSSFVSVRPSYGSSFTKAQHISVWWQLKCTCFKGRKEVFQSRSVGMAHG